MVELTHAGAILDGQRWEVVFEETPLPGGRQPRNSPAGDAGCPYCRRRAAQRGGHPDAGRHPGGGTHAACSTGKRIRLHRGLRDHRNLVRRGSTKTIAIKPKIKGFLSFSLLFCVPSCNTSAVAVEFPSVTRTTDFLFSFSFINLIFKIVDTLSCNLAGLPFFLRTSFRYAL